MWSRSPVLVAVGLVIFTTSGGAVWAQGAENSVLEVPGPGEPGQKDLPIEQMLAEAESIQVTIEGAAQAISQMLREARQTDDVVHQLCLDDKLNQIDVASQSATDSLAAMKAAADAREAIQMRRGYFVMLALAETAATLSAEANQCIGGDTGDVKGASLNVTMDPEIPRGETTGVSQLGSGTVVPNTATIQDPPQSASPVM